MTSTRSAADVAPTRTADDAGTAHLSARVDAGTGDNHQEPDPSASVSADGSEEGHRTGAVAHADGAHAGSVPAFELTANQEVVANPGADDERLWSVTTILKSFGDSEGLIRWTATETARAAVTSIRTLHAMLEDGNEQAAIEWLQEARFRRPRGQRSATGLGIDVHAACELYVVTGTRPALGTPLPNGELDAEVAPYLDTFELWLDRFQPAYHAAEVTVYNPKYGYAGTADGYATIEGTDCIIDYKSSKVSLDGRGKRKMPWSDVALQLAGYRFAPLAAVWRARKYEQWSRRYYLLSPDERELAVPTPNVDAGVCVFLTPHHCDVFPVDCGTEVFEQFLFAIEAARWSLFSSKRVIGEPLALLTRKAD